LGWLQQASPSNKGPWRRIAGGLSPIGNGRGVWKPDLRLADDHITDSRCVGRSHNRDVARCTIIRQNNCDPGPGRCRDYHFTSLFQLGAENQDLARGQLILSARGTCPPRELQLMGGLELRLRRTAANARTRSVPRFAPRPRRGGDGNRILLNVCRTRAGWGSAGRQRHQRATAKAAHRRERDTPRHGDKQGV